MNHLKYITFILLLLLSFTRCTEIYNPNISSDKEALIVEGLITDEEGPFTVKLSKAKPLPFDSVNSTTYLVGKAQVTIIDSEKKTYTLNESTFGNYSTPPEFVTKVGNSYKLRIVTREGIRYESNSEKLLPPQSYDSIRAIYSAEDYLNSNNEMQNVVGADIRVDLFKSLSNLDSVVSCRFNTNMTIQYSYTARDLTPKGDDEIDWWHWFRFRWKTFSLNTINNITDEKSTAVSNYVISNHSLGFMPFELKSYNLGLSYGLVIPEPIIIYYLRVNQYTMNNDSYQFYKAANNQLSASGKLFDPITSQLYGNINCLSTPSRTVLGLFEVSSVRKHGFLIAGSVNSKNVSVTKAPVMDVPSDSKFEYLVWDNYPMPVPDDPMFDPIPLPNWWFHN